MKCFYQQSSRSSASDCHWIPLGNSAAAEPVASSSSPRRGFTLLEMMLVLGVIAVFMSMTVPSVMKIFHQEKLNQSAEKIRAAAAMARVRAIESGVIYQFCCELSGNHFVVAPFEADHYNTYGVSNTGNRWSHFAGSLPKGISLTSAIAGLSAAGPTAGNSYHISSTSLAGLPNGADLASLNWSTPVLFNSDGSANVDTEITVSDNRAQRIRLRIRALTGAVSIGRLYTEKR